MSETSADSPRTDEHGRPEPPDAAPELDTVLGFLRFQRATFVWKTDGLTAAQLRQPLAPSDMTLAGMTKHLAFVEDYWFGHVLREQPPAEPWASVDWDADPDWDWHSAASDDPDSLRALWRQAVQRSDAALAAALADGGLDQVAPRRGVSLRWILVHMVEEYARHNGHADLLRQAIDGQAGE